MYVGCNLTAVLCAPAAHNNHTQLGSVFYLGKSRRRSSGWNNSEFFNIQIAGESKVGINLNGLEIRLIEPFSQLPPFSAKPGHLKSKSGGLRTLRFGFLRQLS
jgi:hypothetical protein